MWKLIRVEKETECNCWHCGAAIKYSCWIEDEETGEILAVGRDCCKEFMAGRRLAETRKEADIQIGELKTATKLEKFIVAKAERWTPKQLANHIRCYLSPVAMQKHFPAYYQIYSQG